MGAREGLGGASGRNVGRRSVDAAEGGGRRVAEGLGGDLNGGVGDGRDGGAMDAFICSDCSGLFELEGDGGGMIENFG